jgi:hypothetical protein
MFMAQFNATAKQVTATIGKIDGRALRNAIQTAAMHVMAYGHSPLANTLNDRMQAIPMTRKLAPSVITFLTANGPLNYGASTGFVFSKAKRDKLVEAFDDGEGAFDYEAWALEVEQWDDMARADRKATTLDMVKAVDALVKKAEKKVVDGAVVDAELIPFLKALLGQYAGKKALAAASASSAQVAVPAAVEASPVGEAVAAG